MSEMKITVGMCSAAKLKEDYFKYQGVSQEYIVYVEGKTDQRFYSKILDDRLVQCWTVKEMERAESRYWYYKSNKRKIVESVKSMKNPPNFGIVDRDHEKKEEEKGIFYTDTRDLESILIFSDEQLYTKLGCSISSDDYSKSLFMAYQWGYVKQKINLYNYPKNTNINDGIELCFNDALQICIASVREYLKKNNGCFLSDDQEQIIDRFIKTDKNIYQGVWNTSYQTVRHISDLWDFVGGHDFEYFLKIINQDVANEKNFGYALIDNYDISCFKSTNLYRLLSMANLVKI